MRTHVHTSTLTIQNSVYNQLKQITNRDLGRGRYQRGGEDMAGLPSWINSCLEFRFEGVQRGFLSERKGKVIPCRGAEDRKGAGTSSGKSGTRNQENGSSKSRAESTGGCVN